MLRFAGRFVVVVLCLMAAVPSAIAQQMGSVSGRILDPDGLVLPGATITVTEQNTGFTRNVVSVEPGQFNGPHSITTDHDGNLYLAEVFNGRVQKFRPKPGADPAKVVGQEHRYTGAAATN